jgi:hypothetical protein
MLPHHRDDTHQMFTAKFRSMKRKIHLMCTVALIFTFTPFQSFLYAQDKAVDSALMDRVTELEKQMSEKKSGDDHFMVAGLATFGFVSNTTTTTSGGIGQKTKTSSFPDADHFEFSPLFLWRHGSRFLLEFEPSFDGFSLGVNWADVSYFVTPGLILRAGYLVTPFGTYNKRLAAGWIDKLPTDPTGVADYPPTSDFGIEAEGGLPLGSMKWNYDVSLTNGLQLLPDGELQSVGAVDNNRNKTITGRLGLLPISNSSLEVGVSGMYGTVGDANTSLETAKSVSYAFDLNYVKLFNPILVNFKGQANFTYVNSQQYVNDTDSSLYTFDNKTTSSFAQIALRPTGSQNNFIKNLEIAFRYGHYVTPENSLWGQKSDIIDASLNYWITWRTVFKLGYQSNNGTSTSLLNAGDKIKSESLFIQFSIQL